MRECDKCGGNVEPKNDVGYFDAQRKDLPFILMAAAALNETGRHLLPVCNEAGGKVCEGSPSRAQFLEGQPRDPRYPEYDLETEKHYREIFAKMQSEEFAKLTGS